MSPELEPTPLESSCPSIGTWAASNPSRRIPATASSAAKSCPHSQLRLVASFWCLGCGGTVFPVRSFRGDAVDPQR